MWTGRSPGCGFTIGPTGMKLRPRGAGNGDGDGDRDGDGGGGGGGGEATALRHLLSASGNGCKGSAVPWRTCRIIDRPLTVGTSAMITVPSVYSRSSTGLMEMRCHGTSCVKLRQDNKHSPGTKHGHVICACRLQE